MPSFPRAAEDVESLAERVQAVVGDYEIGRRVSDVLGQDASPLEERESRRRRVEEVLRQYRERLADRDRIKEELAAANAQKEDALAALRECLKEELNRIEVECSDQRMPADLSREILSTIEEGKIDHSDQAPPPPTDLAATPKGKGQVELSWRRPPRTKGGRVANYLIEVRRGEGAWQMASVAYSNAIIIEQQPEGRCEFRVRAQNRAGTSATGPVVDVWIP